MGRTVILVIRHAERPGAAFGEGITESGSLDEESLTVRGWQRAGALAVLLSAPGTTSCRYHRQSLHPRRKRCARSVGNGREARAGDRRRPCRRLRKD